MRNIFRLSTKLSEEDRFTASLHYLIDCIPAIGQDIVNLLTTHAQLPAARFLQAADHPHLSATNRPDLLLLCEAFDIVCEHKVASGLGPFQLERYLTIPRPKHSYVTLIARASLAIPEAVIQHPRYLRPRVGQVPHFRWNDLYAQLAQRHERLTQDFVEYMKTLGMEPDPVAPTSPVRSDARRRHSIEELCQQADSEGIGIAFRTILARTAYWLQPRGIKASIGYTPKESPRHMLFTVSTQPTPYGRLQVYITPGAFSEFYVISRRDVQTLLGDEGWRELDHADLDRFLDSLDTIFRRILITIDNA